MNSRIRAVVLLALLVLGAVTLVAGPPREVYYEYYTDGTYTVMSGEKWILCTGVVSWGTPTEWFKIYYGPDC